MNSKKNNILSHNEIKNKIKRIAYQIYESNVDEDDIVLAGIAENGYIIAKKLKQILSKITELNIILCKVEIDKRNPLNTIKTSINSKEYINKSIVLVDDVLNSGATLMYCTKHFLEVPIKQFKTAILVNRNHKKYPIKADYKGISLSTSLHEHVEVVLENGNFEVSLK